MKKIGFDHDKYLEEQSRYIMERVNRYEKLYLEFGGKLIGDFHAMRVLPGFDPDAKIKLLYKLRDITEIIICVYAGDIEHSKIRGDYGITYDLEVLRMIDEFKKWDLKVNGVVITRYNEQVAAKNFVNKLERRGVRVYTHTATKGYPLDIETIVSEEGYGKNTFIQTNQSLVVITAPGPNSGKLATSLSQLYHEFSQGKQAGYSKFETFPIWNLPLKHPVNIAYEAATSDLQDVNMIDPFHLEAYGKSSVNYNRDIDAFPLLKRIIGKISGRQFEFQSPTDMGVNRAGFCIVDDEAVQFAANQEIIRRYFKTACDYKKGNTELTTFQRCRLLMEELQLKEDDRKVVPRARAYAEMKQNGSSEPVAIAAVELPSGEIVTGKGSETMTATAAALLNAIKFLAGLDDELHLISPIVLEPMRRLKNKIFSRNKNAFNSKEMLLALSITAATNTVSQVALQQLAKLKGCQAHVTVILNKTDEDTCRSLGIDVTSDDNFNNNSLYYE